MPSIEGHYRPELQGEPLYFRHPLAQLHNQPLGTREGFGLPSNSLESTKRSFYSSDPTAQNSSAVPLSRPVSNGTSTIPMLAPTYGGLYKSSSHVNGYLEQTSRHQSPQREVSPKHVEVRDGSVEGFEKNPSSESDQIAPYLQIPSTINSSKGSLADFTSQITCLVWFESSFTLHRVEGSRNTPVPMSPLVQEAKPTLGFRKWVTTILSTTQVSTNVILLALMFIYRLKILNPTVKGKPGSEYRLLTVALMLGNKFLDDNTYTNKTWAEVSGISVSEIHIMEVEFLSNMRYTLYASKEEWCAWQDKLSRFYDYFERALKTPTELPAMASLEPVNDRPTSYSSPPSNYNSPSIRLATPMAGTTRPPPPPTPSHLASYNGPALSSPVPRMPEVDLRPNTRKRSYDGISDEPQAKRVSRNPSVSSTANSTPGPRLPVPTLSRANPPYNPYPSHPAHLPPPTGRAMSSVYGQYPPHSGDFLKPQPNALPNLGIKIPPMEHAQSRALPSATGSMSSSPINMAMTPNSDLLSPLNYNIHRSSPYKPVRSVNTLLIPPPSASLQSPSSNIDFNYIQYQPLGKPSERRPGVVPYVPQAYPPQSWAPSYPYQSIQ